MIIINGKTYEGNNVSIIDNVVTVDGVVLDNKDSKLATLKIEGNIVSLKTDLSVHVTGDVGSVVAGGSVHSGNVGGNVQSGGSVHCEGVRGGVQAGGNIKINRIS